MVSETRAAIRHRFTYIRTGSSTLMAGSKVKMLMAAQAKAHVATRTRLFRTKSKPYDTGQAMAKM